MTSNEQSSPNQFPHSSTALAIDFSKLPCYLCHWSPPFRKDIFREPVLKTLQQRAASVRRPLTPDETIALAYYEARSVALGSWALPVGAMTLFHVCYYNKLKLTTFRYGAYGLFPTACIFAFEWILTTRGIAKDPRLTDFNADLGATRHGVQKSTSELWKDAKDARREEKAQGEEASSLAGRGGTKHAGDEWMVGEGDFGKAKHGAQAKLQEIRQQPVLSNSPQSNRTAAKGHDPSLSSRSHWSQEPFDGGSAWERIRRGAGLSASGKNEHWGTTDGRGTGEQRESSGSSGGDEFSFSSSEQERSYAQVEAQRDFDARVEKERQGGDFSEGSDGGGRR